jgi:predicted helicase
LRGHRVTSELGLRGPFQSLLHSVAKARDWALVSENEVRIGGGRRVRPDGTVKDDVNLVRGYWEAKDSGDKLDDEIKAKIRAGYPTSNIIFEDTTTAVLFQHGAEVFRIELSNIDRLETLLHEFFSYREPEIAEFEHAVQEFKERVPDLAAGLKRKIDQSHATNQAFKRSFASFLELCRGSINPNISSDVVEEMLVQHILTERLIRRIFDNPEFVRRNVIAAEVERVMDALTSESFDRNTYLKDLDRFYIAIERAARTMTEFSDKQHFLNTVYERFFQGYSTKLADTLGIVYTPQAIVDFMCSSVETILEKDFGKSLSSPDVFLIDPCTGTGNFIVNLMRRLPKSELEHAYRERFFANEVMLLPYYISALNIEHAYYEQLGAYEPFQGLCFVDSLDIGEHPQHAFSFMTAENSARVERQRAAPITVVVGNPPYNAAQSNENDNNKNRKYPRLDSRIRDTYVRDSSATLKAQLYDPYVRFFRWASDRLGNRDGIVCYISNNNFVSKRSFDGLRKHLAKDFSQIYHIDLHGDVRENPKLSGTTHNVFGIQVGVGITLAVRQRQRTSKSIFYWRASEFWRKEDKLQFLVTSKNIAGVDFQTVEPDSHNTWLHLENANEYESFTPMGNKAAKATRGEVTNSFFKTYSGGVKSNRDSVVYDFDREALAGRMEAFIGTYNSEVDRFLRDKTCSDIDQFVNYDVLKWDGTLKNHLAKGQHGEFAPEKIREAIFRPFVKKNLYYDRLFNNSVYLQSKFFPNSESERDNRAIVVTNEPQISFSALMVNVIPCLHVGGRQGQCFPYYVYDENGENRTENVTDWVLAKYRDHYSDDSITKWEIFHYVYGILHHPSYRDRFSANLRRDLPRIPLVEKWRPIATAGACLADLHVSFDNVEPWPIKLIETPTLPLDWRVERMALSKDRTSIRLNASLTLAEIPSDAFSYQVGNRSPLEWIIDQYRITEFSDPNDPSNPKKIVDLISKVITVSVKTVDVVKGMPTYFE